MPDVSKSGEDGLQAVLLDTGNGAAGMVCRDDTVLISGNRGCRDRLQYQLGRDEEVVTAMVHNKKEQNNIDIVNNIIKTNIKDRFTGYIRIDMAEGTLVTVEQSSKMRLNKK